MKLTTNETKGLLFTFVESLAYEFANDYASTDVDDIERMFEDGKEALLRFLARASENSPYQTIIHTFLADMIKDHGEEKVRQWIIELELEDEER